MFRKTVSTARVVAVLAAAFSFSALAVVAQAAPPPGGNLDFTVLRNGSEVGRHEMRFRNEADGLKIDIRTNVAVKVAFITAYRFEHEGHEIWQNGRLVRLWSKTNDDGTPHVLDVSAGTGDLSIMADGKQAEKAAVSIPASLWNERIVQQRSILNTLDGSRMNIAVADMGPETVPVKGQPVPARRYAITGDLQRELWYDAQNVLVKVRFKAKDGSDIEYLRQ
jgi:hypothetical protein